ncbi:glycosyl hydrolase family 95 catalytic domain-containing protein [Streptomyces sp. NPDC050287]|uniref:glycosyl hydrolase family 95 catalytic domain-containing protein n=1 Tax=Streptomyces sp. NPDC050287 TaxID=3365608 RepID=UPI0037B23940
MSTASLPGDSSGLGSGVDRRSLLKLGGLLGASLAISGLPVFTSKAQAVTRPGTLTLVPPATATRLRYTSPGSAANIMQEGLAVGNGRLGAMVTGDPASDALYLTDITLWTGGANASLGSDGQFPYGVNNFGSYQSLAQARVSVPAHALSAVTGYQRVLDLSNGYVSASYQYNGVTYTREVYSSNPDDVLIVRLKQSGGGSYTGSVSLSGTHGETTSADSAGPTASFSGTLANGLKYACAVAVTATGGTVAVSGSSVTFTSCSEVILVFSGGTNYKPDRTVGYKDSTLNPLSVALAKANAVAGVSGDSLLATHVVDYQALYNATTVNLGASSAAQRAMDTPSRLTARAASGAAPDPELEASYLQFGRYLTITGSRGSLPTNLQGLWLDNNNPAWMSDYHTDINVQMNYWLPDRAGLGSCFDAFANYCVAQLPGWTATTQSLFQSSTNGFRNSSGKVAGWTVAISTNTWGGGGWWWHPAGNAWLANTLYSHYEFTLDASYLQRIYPLLKGACQFWEARLITDPGTGKLIDDADWSPEHGPRNAKGITYAQELVWQLFQNYTAAAAKLNQDSAYAATIAGLQANLYLPQVSPTTGWLEEWMTPDNLDTSDITHRHLSPLAGLFPGDRITADQSPAALLTGITNLLTARGMNSFGWGMAWRALCWARLKNAGMAYQAVTTVLQPSVNFSNGTAINFFDMYSFGSSSVFQIDANFGTPSAMIEMLVYNRPGLVELLPALPDAWSAAGSVTGVPVRGAMTLDMAWSGGQVTTATLHGTPGAGTTVKFGAWSRAVTVGSGGTVTVTPPPRATVFNLVNRRSGKAIDVPGSSTTAGTALIQYTLRNSPNQQWKFAPAATGYTITNVNSGLVTDVKGGNTADGTAIIQWPANTSTNQEWTLADAGDGYVKLVCVRSGKVMGVSQDSTSDLAGITQQTDTGDISQHWQRIAVG